MSLRLRILLTLTILLSLQSTAVLAIEFGRPSLSGIKSFSVVVELLNAEAERAGLRTDQLRTDVELRLRIAKLPLKERLESSWLHIDVKVLEAAGFYTYLINLQFHQPALLGTRLDSEFGRQVSHEVLDMPVALPDLVVTWSESTLGVVGTKAQPETTIRTAVKDIVDRFANDFLAANSN